jgi:hypothetical protein
MTWAQYCDGKKWESPLVMRYAVQSIPTTFLIDQRGRIIGRNLVGEQLNRAIASALDTRQQFWTLLAVAVLGLGWLAAGVANFLPRKPRR